MVDSRKLETVRSIVRRNHGLVTRRQLKLAKLSKDEISEWRIAGRLVRLCPSIFRTDDTEETWELRAHAALGWAGDRAALCRETAAAVHGLKGYEREGPIHVTLPTRQGLPKLCSFEMVLHSHRELGFWDAALYRGMRITRVERTLLDIAGHLSDERVEDLIDDAMTRDLTRPAYLRACYARLKKGGRQGCGPFRRILRRRGKTLVRLDSPLEKELLQIIAGAKLPLPEARWWVPENARAIYRLDLAYPKERLAIEADSREHHSKELDLIDDQIRQNDIVSWGWSVLRFRTFQLRDPARIARVIRTSLAGRTQRSSSPEQVAPEFPAADP
jgi:very-short-patch-repair endonuclease